MSYPFDATLVPNVLTDLAFQRTGIYIGSSNGLFYCVVDPRRHDVDVWEKLSSMQILRIWGNAAWPYMLSALHQRFEFFTNGPMMTPPSPAPSGWRRAWEYLITVLGLSAQWSPVNTVVHRSTIMGIPNGPPYNNAYFGRSASGRFTFYTIAADPAPAAMIECMGGLTRIVANGAVVTGGLSGIDVSGNVAGWALVPFTPPIDTAVWEVERYLEPSDGSPQDTAALHGLIVAAASDQGYWSFTLATDFVVIGASEAVALDGSDSVTCGCGTALLIRCAFHKDAMQRFGLCVRQ